MNKELNEEPVLTMLLYSIMFSSCNIYHDSNTYFFQSGKEKVCTTCNEDV
mgnify:CR=1 FL=1